MTYGDDIAPERRAETVGIKALLKEGSAKYELVTGENLKVVFNADRLNMFETHRDYTEEEVLVGKQLSAIGIEYVGEYTVDNTADVAESSMGQGSLADGTYVVGAFNYHKLGGDGEIETGRRLIIISGFGAGVHSDHAGQYPTAYVVGPQIGVREYGEAEPLLIPDGQIAQSKNFSLDCILGGLRGDDPVIANG